MNSSVCLRILRTPSWLTLFPRLFVQSSHLPSQRPPQPRVMSIRTCVQSPERVSAAHIKIDKGGSYIIGTAARFGGRGREKKKRTQDCGKGRDLRARLEYIRLPFGSVPRGKSIARNASKRGRRRVYIANVPDRRNGAPHAP